MKNRKLKLQLISMLLIAINSCQLNDTTCTTEWKCYTVNVKDSSGSPVILDDYFTKNSLTGEIIRFQDNHPYLDSISKIHGSYMIISDGEQDWATKEATEIIFKGFIDTIEVISERYTIGTNGCHIELLNGKTNIVIE